MKIHLGDGQIFDFIPDRILELLGLDFGAVLGGFQGPNSVHEGVQVKKADVYESVLFAIPKPCFLLSQGAPKSKEKRRRNAFKIRSAFKRRKIAKKSPT